MDYKRISIAFLFSVFALKLFANNILNEDRPRLVVQITIEQMDKSYMSKFWSDFQQGGFKRLMDNGAVCQNGFVNMHNINTASTVASVSTGAYSEIHGIVNTSWYKQYDDVKVKAVEDNYALTLGSDSEIGNCSAKNLMAFTFGDILKQTFGNNSKVYSVALNAQSAVLSAGHAADGAYWFDGSNGHMISSSYYIDEFPDWVSEFNEKNFPELYINKTWDLLLPSSSYNKTFEDDYILEKGYWGRYNTFPHHIEKINDDAELMYEIVKATPMGNSLIKDFAVELIEKEKLGEDEVTDLLNITFSSLDFANKWFGKSSVEMHDLYLRLDIELKHLLNSLDEKFGKDNYLIMLTSTGGTEFSTDILKDEYNFPAGNFSPEKVSALVKSYLNAIYGVGKWLKLYNGEQLYLNHELIESKEIDLSAMQDQIALFINQFQGVKRAVPAHTIQVNNFSDSKGKMLNSFYRKRSGDVMIELEEGWYPTYKYQQVDYTTNSQVPLVFYGRTVKPQVISNYVEVTDIVPTICSYLKINAPQSATGTIIPEIFWK